MELHSKILVCNEVFKNIVIVKVWFHKTEVRNIENLWMRILEECNKIIPNVFVNVKNYFINQSTTCQDVGESQFEHLLNRSVNCTTWIINNGYFGFLFKK